MDLKEEEILGGQVESHWYYASKAAAMQAYLDKDHYAHVLDVGAGSGFFTKHLLKAGAAKRGTCVDTGYAEDHSQTVAGRPLEFVRSYTKPDADLILFMDVLEHVPDDAALLKSYTDTARTGTEVFITVPAFAFLWSGHDVFLEHYRRYTTTMLEATMKNAGLTPVRCTYYFGAVFPLAAGLRLLRKGAKSEQTPKSDLRQHSVPVNEGLKLLCALERPFVRYNRLAGLSVLGLARKD
jgi:trans-aconitate methyltransferase